MRNIKRGKLRSPFHWGAAIGRLGAALSLALTLLASCSARGGQIEPPRTADAEVSRLADLARAAFQSRMNPPVLELTLPQIAARDATTIARDFALVCYTEALDALVEEARSPETAYRVRTALSDIVYHGGTELAEPIFRERTRRRVADGADERREAAAAERHRVALTALPAALTSVIGRPSDPPSASWGGDEARTAYARAAELSPDDPWTWIGLSLLETGNQASEHAIREAERAARNAHDARAQIVALQAAGIFDAGNARQSAAEQALNQALSRAQQWVSEEPADPTAWRYLALSFMRLGDYLRETGRHDPAAAAYSQALAVRQRLAATDPTSQPRMLDVVASHLWLWAEAEATGDKAAADIHRGEAYRIYRSLLSGDAFKPIITLHSGAAMSVLLAAGGLTLLVGLVGLALYRRTLARYMRASASTRRTTQNTVRPHSTMASVNNEVALLRVDTDQHLFTTSARISPAVAYSRRAFRLASWIYGVAGSAFGAAAAGVFLGANGVEEVTWYQILTQTLCWSWPVILTLALLWGPDRKLLWSLVGGYLFLLLLLCIQASLRESPPPVEFGVTIPRFFVPVVIWTILSSDTLFLLLILNRRLRAVGTVLFIFMLVVAIGGFAVLVASSTYAGMSILSQIFNSGYFVFLVPLIGSILFAPIGWLAIGMIRRIFDARYLSEHTLIFDFIWLWQAIVLSSRLSSRPWLAVVPFAIYKLITLVGLRSVSRQAPPTARLLLLRTFGYRRRSERLFDLLGARWRYAGPINLIAAPDLAGRLIDPGKLLDFFAGHLRRRFIIEPGDLDRRLSEFRDARDADGRYRVNELFCGDDVWQKAVERLMAGSDLVAMDLRGFSATNEGCRYELSLLVDTVPLEKAVLLIDETTDSRHLQQTLAQCWGDMSDISPNRLAQRQIRTLETRRDLVAVEQLLAYAGHALAPQQSKAAEDITAARGSAPVSEQTRPAV